MLVSSSAATGTQFTCFTSNLLSSPHFCTSKASKLSTCVGLVECGVCTCSPQVLSLLALLVHRCSVYLLYSPLVECGVCTCSPLHMSLFLAPPTTLKHLFLGTKISILKYLYCRRVHLLSSPHVTLPRSRYYNIYFYVLEYL